MCFPLLLPHGQLPLYDCRGTGLFTILIPLISLNNSLFCRETIHYLAAMSKIPIEIQRERIPTLLQQVHLWKNRKRKVRKLSGEMKRRLGLAQAPLNNPKVLIVDEPTACLDPEERLRFYNLPAEFSSDRIVIVSSHIVADIEAVCVNVAVLDSGHLLFAGSIEKLAEMARGKVYELTIPKMNWKRQNKTIIFYPVKDIYQIPKSVYCLTIFLLLAVRFHAYRLPATVTWNYCAYWKRG